MATANLFTANQSDVETDISGFYVSNGTQGNGQGPLTVGGVTISRDTGQAWHGASSFKVATDGGGTFQDVEVRVPVFGQFAPGGVYTLSCYIYSAAGGPTLRFYCQADTGNIGSVPNITLLAGWNRYTVTVTLPNPVVQAYIGLRVDTGGTAQAVTLWLDGLQFESGASATPWVLGGGASKLAVTATLVPSPVGVQVSIVAAQPVAQSSLLPSPIGLAAALL